MDTRKEALRVCRRLARGKINDAVELLYEPKAPEQLQKLDLYCIAELKHSDKGVEIKFADRLKAAQMLAQLGEEDNVQPLFSALKQSAEAVRETEAGRAVDAV